MEEEGGGGVRDHPHGPRPEQDGPSLQLCSGQVHLYCNEDLMVQSVNRYPASMWCEYGLISYIDTKAKVVI